MSQTNAIHRHVERDYPDYLRDESRKTGTAESISFPATEADLKHVLLETMESGLAVTLQGARTGITAGAVPSGGHIVNLSRMNRILGLRRHPSEDAFVLRVQSGLLLTDLRRAVARKDFDTAEWSPESMQAVVHFRQAGLYFFPPDPTETTASIGGMVACNASGARTYGYGPTRPHVERLRVLLSDGSALELARGWPRATGRQFAVDTDGGRRIEGTLPSYRMPAVKNAAGYFAKDDMDLLDLFIGSEGTLGVLSEIEIRLIPAPRAVWGVMAFFPAEPEAVGFVEAVRCGATKPVAIEFFDHGALDLLRRQRRTNPAFSEVPEMPEGWHTGVYVEYHGTDETSVEDAVAGMSETMAACGGDPDATWLMSSERELDRLKDFRHAVPEAVNLLIDERRRQEPGLTKLGTDLAVPDAALREILGLYHRDLDRSGLEHVIFGHIGDNHLHVNIIPKSLQEYERGRAIYGEWARAAVRLHGSVAAEHGVGKLKAALLKEMYGEQGIREMRALKKLFDPVGRLNPGNLFETGER
jgi:D-lactate dehydrogenase (cytochrome)